MENDSPGSRPAMVAECSRKRLAENSIVAVDVCSCGVMQLHLGALTLRMSPCAVSELIATLQKAVDVNARDQGYDASAVEELPLAPRRHRGQA